MSGWYRSKIWTRPASKSRAQCYAPPPHATPHPQTNSRWVKPDPNGSDWEIPWPGLNCQYSFREKKFFLCRIKSPIPWERERARVRTWRWRVDWCGCALNRLAAAARASRDGGCNAGPSSDCLLSWPAPYSAASSSGTSCTLPSSSKWIRCSPSIWGSRNKLYASAAAAVSWLSSFWKFERWFTYWLADKSDWDELAFLLFSLKSLANLYGESSVCTSFNPEVYVSWSINPEAGVKMSF